MSKTFRAEITFTSTESGGYRNPQPGVRPQLVAGDILTTCIIWSNHSIESFHIGVPIEVVLELPFWDEYRDKFHEGMEIILCDGSRVIARGKFLDILVNGSS